MAPPLDARELDSSEAALEIVIVWGEQSVLHVAHLSPPQPYCVGEAADLDAPGPADFLIGEDCLGVRCLPIVRETAGELVVVIPAEASGEIVLAGTGDRELAGEGERISFEQLAAQGLLRDLPALAGARQYPLARGTQVRFRAGDFTFLVRTVAAARRVGTGDRATLDWQRSKWTAASWAFHAALLICFYLLPPSSSALSMDRIDAGGRLVQYAIAAQTREEEPPPRWIEPDARPDRGGGARAPGDEGQAGTQKDKTPRRRIVTAPTRAEPALPYAGDSGIIAILRQNAVRTGAVYSTYDRSQADRYDANAIDALLPDRLDDSFGFGGLGPRGVGRGGGGDARGAVGSGGLGTRGRSEGPGGEGYGASDGTGGYRARDARIPRVRTGQPDTHGALSKEIIRRVIGRHINEVRFCYEQQLIAHPDLQGRVAIKFIITATGAVQSAVVEQSDLQNTRAEQCIAQAVRRWSFPAPEGGGLVIVSYPFALSQAGP